MEIYSASSFVLEISHIGYSKQFVHATYPFNNDLIILLKEMISLRGDVIFTEEATKKEKIVRLRFNRLVKEMKEMSRRHTETLFRRLFEGNDENGESEAEELDERRSDSGGDTGEGVL